MTSETLPLINATLNSVSTLLLCTGWVFARQRKFAAHASIMLSAFVTSTAFLVCYLIHKVMFGERSIGLPSGIGKTMYLFGLLLPHVLLAIVMLPMILTTLWRAYRRDWMRHRKIAVPTFWIWLYVSVTGVVIYILLYHVFPIA